MTNIKSVNLLHCSDLHLGASFSSLPPRIAAERSNDLRSTFLKIIEICKAEKIQLLLIAGDLFDSIHVPDSLLDLVRNAFASIPDTFVAIAPGNHDPAVFDSPYRNKAIWPENVYIFTEGFSYLDLPILNVRLWGAGFTNVYQDDPLLLYSKYTDTDLLNICVMHGDIVQTGVASSYNPITVSEIADSCMDYLALGHIHKRTDICKSGAGFYAYPGSPEGLGFDEQGPRGVYMGEISRGVCDMRFYALNKREYTDIQINVTGLQRQDIVKQMRDKIRSDKTKAVDNLIKITLTGTVSEDSSVSPEYAASALSDVFFFTLSDQTVIDVQQRNDTRDYTLRNIFIRKMRERLIQRQDDETLKLAMKLGLRAFNEKIPYMGAGDYH